MSLLLMATLPRYLSQSPPSNYYSLCEQQYECGEFRDVYYPFWGENRPRQCGGDGNFQLFCHEENDEKRPYTYIEMGSQRFNVVTIETLINYYRVKLVPLSVDDVCSLNFNYSLNYSPFSYNQTVHNITIFYNCTYSSIYPDYHSLGCAGGDVVYYNGTEKEVLESHQDLKNCHHRIQVAAEAVRLKQEGGDDASALHFGEGVLENYTFSQDCMSCLNSGGTCGSNNTDQFTCYCPHGSNALQCSPPDDNRPRGKRHHSRWILIATGSGVTAVVIAIAGLMAAYFTCKSSRIKSNQDIETFLRDQAVLTLKRYKFLDVKKMTNSFQDKLGQGDFGVVYKGKLSNGSDVAVKMLNQSKENGEDFINEVTSISRTSHVNVVTLLGFCLEGHKKVLIYEFMSNGSLDNFIYKEEPKNAPFLSWDNLYQISIGIARGLEYLHRGCNIRILHFDKKPHNILLDENFCPKISDFGLAKLCPRKESHISMSKTRGTIGYIAPEVWNRHFGRVSHKSDVYSYGMMLLEIIGMKEKNTITDTSQTSEMYFPDWIYKRLDQGTQLGPDDDGEVAIEENDIVKKMTVVGLWCIQPIPDDRPTMSRVVEMLEGSMNSLELPPRPVLSSPIRSAIEPSTMVLSLVESSHIVN